MANRWNIPKDVESHVSKRDETCAYCNALFKDPKESKKGMKTWEHIINDLALTGEDNIV